VTSGTASFELEAPGEEEMRSRRASVLERQFPYLVAETGDGVVIGYAYGGPYRLRPAYRLTVEHSIYIDPDWVGRGVGKLLLQELIRACEQQGLREMVAVIGDSANHASIRLHAGAGFQHVGVLRNVGFKFGKWLDTVLMQLPLGPRP
jgi:L-amino acid N-acyltransferase YncA